MNRLLALWACLGFATPSPDLAYRASEEQWRRLREAQLRAEDGWLAISGLSWLREGRNICGSDPNADVVLPKPAPARAGVFVRAKRRVTFEPAPGVPVKMNGQSPTVYPLRSDMNGPVDYLQLGDLTFWIIERGQRVGVRIRDRNSKYRREFRGLDWWPVDERFRITARWVAKPSPLRVVDVTGSAETLESPGYALFTIAGREQRLIANPSGTELFFVFRDETSGRSSYPAGRFLYAPMPQDGRVMLDFNRAVSPPCAYTPYATCPLPPPGNSIPVPVTAGEKYRKP